MGRLLEAWTPLTVAINSMNRSMGQPELHPFVLPAQTVLKFEFICAVIAGSARAASTSMMSRLLGEGGY